MSPAPSKPTLPLDDGNLDEIGACLAGIRALSNHNGAIDEEDARAVYSLTCIALAEWRKLDAAADTTLPPRT